MEPIMKIVSNLFDIRIHCATRLRMGGICISLQLKKIVFLLPALCNFWSIVHLKLYFTLMLMHLFVHVCMICYAP